MEVEVISSDKYGDESYKNLFTEIMADVGKVFQMEKAMLVLKPEIPLFVFSVMLRTEPASMTVGDVADIRAEGGSVHLTVTDERYASEILKELWSRYGKDAVEQQTRFDMEIKGIPEKDIESIVISSGEDYLREIVGAVWRSMPEGIKNRRTFIDGQVVTVVATEERLEPYMLEEGMSYHRKMIEEGGRDV